jgi:hypothetical protein
VLVDVGERDLVRAVGQQLLEGVVGKRVLGVDVDDQAAALAAP